MIECGHLFQNRYNSKCVETEYYLKNLVRYIHQNPQKAGICLTEKFYWSSYTEYVGNKSLVDTEFVMKLFDDNLNSFKKYNLKIVDCFEDDIEYEFILKIDDRYAEEIIKKKLRLDNINDIINFNKEIRDRYIHEIKKIKVISCKQISRLLNIDRKIVERA